MVLWEIIFFVVILKIPVAYVGGVVWWAIKAEPEVSQEDGGSGGGWKAGAAPAAERRALRAPRGTGNVPSGLAGACAGSSRASRVGMSAERRKAGRSDTVAGALFVVGLLAGVVELFFRPFIFAPVGLLAVLTGSMMSGKYRRVSLVAALRARRSAS